MSYDRESARKKYIRIFVILAAVALVVAMTIDAWAMMGKGKMGSMDKDRPCPMETAGGMTGEMMGGMGAGMMGSGMGHHMLGKDVDVEVKDVSDGVSITLTSKDKLTVKRLRIIGEMMKLSRELKELTEEEK